MQAFPFLTLHDKIDITGPEGLSAGFDMAGLSVTRFALLIGAPSAP